MNKAVKKLRKLKSLGRGNNKGDNIVRVPKVIFFFAPAPDLTDRGVTRGGVTPPG